MITLKMQLEKINKKLDKLSKKLETKQIIEYVELMNNTKSLILKNFVIGLAKGVGIAIGFTILGAVMIYLLRKVVMLNLPVIGAFVRDIMNIAKEIEKIK